MNAACLCVGVCVGLTWRTQRDSSECPLNPGFHDNVTLLSAMLATFSPTGAAGNTEKETPSPKSHPSMEQHQPQLL